MRPWSLLGDLQNRYGTFSLATQFLLAAAVVVVNAMAILGGWVAGEISSSSLRSVAVTSAVFVEAFLEPNVQELARARALSPTTSAYLDTILKHTPLEDRLVSVKVWLTDGTVVYSTDHELEGQRFVSDAVRRAAAGEVVTDFGLLDQVGDPSESDTDVPLVEVYAPLYRAGTNEIIGVGEYYEYAPWFGEQLEKAKNQTWLVVGITTAAMLGILFLIVWRGSSTIDQQRRELQRQVRETTLLATQNDELRMSADEARLNATESNEQLIGRVGSDLHDGPVQLLSVLMLKLSAAQHQKPQAQNDSPDPTLGDQSLVKITADVLRELRNISTGLSLPELDTMTLAEALQLAISRHEDVTGAKVDLQIGELPVQLSHILKICAYRVVQEALTNSYKHAGCMEPRVSASAQDDTLTLAIADTGHGLGPGRPTEGERPKLGIAGIRNRVSAFKGTLKIESRPGEGTEITVLLPIEDRINS